ncbi:MAG: ATP-binding protein [Granulosicoccus sp.]
MIEFSSSDESVSSEQEPVSIKSTTMCVLLVEDNDDDRAHIVQMIHCVSPGVLLKDVATGSEAIDYFRSNDVDCVILDYRLECEDGLTILAEMKSTRPFCPVIMLTGQGNEEIAANSIKVGAADYLIKQRLTEPYLMSAIKNAISRSALEAKVADQEAERKQFLNILVHDLRAPLRNISHLGSIAVEEAENGNFSGLTDVLSSQKTLAKRATALINSLEDYTLLDRKISSRMVSLTDVVKAACDNLATVIADRHAIIDTEELPMINGHEPLLIQLLQNLIHNGLKYNESQIPRIAIGSTSRSKGNIVLTVKDNGLGIPEKHFSRIFAPLERLWGYSQYEGSGLGLALCQKIAERHGGKIWCTSIEGEGSQFHVRLPAAIA